MTLISEEEKILCCAIILLEMLIQGLYYSKCVAVLRYDLIRSGLVYSNSYFQFSGHLINFRVNSHCKLWNRLFRFCSSEMIMKSELLLFIPVDFFVAFFVSLFLFH